MFQYDGDNLFDVKLLGLLGCDEEGFEHFNINIEDENEEDGEAQVEQVVDDGASEEGDIDRAEDDTNDNIQVHEAEYKTGEDGDVEA